MPLKFAVVLSGFLTGAALSLAPAAGAAPVTLQCGDLVTHSVKLAADVVCQDDSSPGLIVGENGITIDLNGHTVRTVVSHSSQVGIDNSAGHNGVTIRNGTVMTFNTTILLHHASRNGINGVNTFAVGTGISVTGGGQNRIGGSDSDSRGPGIQVSGSPGTEIVHNQLSSAFGAALLVDSDRILIARNSTGGIQISSGAGNVVRRNTITGAASLDGLLVAAATTNTALLRNSASGWAGDGIHVESPSTLIVGNVANDNGNYGIEAVPGVTSAHNHASGNGNPAQCLNVSC